MKDGKHPNPNTIHPIAGYDKEIYVKPTITNPNIIVGDFTYIADSDFESHVSHLYEWNDDKLIIGKFCQIAAGVEFVMNGANHQMNAVSTFPFYTLEGWEMLPPAKADMPLKGDTVIENDVWIGQNAVILPGVYLSCPFGTNQQEFLVSCLIVQLTVFVYSIDTRNNFSYYDKSEPVCVVSRFAFSNNYFEKSAGLSNWNLSE